MFAPQSGIDAISRHAHYFQRAIVNLPSPDSVVNLLESLVRQMQDGGIRYAEAVHEFRKAFLTAMLQRSEGNQCKTARALGVHRNTVSRAMIEFGITKKNVRSMSQQIVKQSARTA